mmetsp:Transcript_35304/g.77322  ORF Transcript_35304/g.77322 Transcript_35304/m.77322 type:complete len:295 (+) Transcript_35304:219-1103(+)
MTFSRKAPLVVRQRSLQRGRLDNLENCFFEFLKTPHHRKIRMRLDDLFGGVEQDSSVGISHHRDVIERISDGNYTEIQLLEFLDCQLLLVPHPPHMSADVPLGIRLQKITEHHRVPQLGQHGQSVLFKSVSEHESAGHHRCKPLQEVFGMRPGLNLGHGLRHISQLDLVLPQNLHPHLHELVIIRLVRRGQPQLLDARLLLHHDPRLRRERPRHVSHHDPHPRLPRLHRAWNHARSLIQDLRDLLAQIVVVSVDGELRVRLDNFFRGHEQDAPLRGLEHGDVVEGVPDGYHSEP